MNGFRKTITALVAILSFCGGTAVCQKETFVVIERHGPDAVRDFIADKIDTAKVLQRWCGLKQRMRAKEVESWLGRPDKIGEQESDHIHPCPG